MMGVKRATGAAEAERVWQQGSNPPGKRARTSYTSGSESAIVAAILLGIL